MSFTRTIEDFTCEHCGFFVKGNGYTNHCPRCLWSKHVDIDPGDRFQTCGGMMEPVETEKAGKKEFIVQKCVRCGFVRKNELNREDDYAVFISVSKKAGVKKGQVN